MYSEFVNITGMSQNMLEVVILGLIAAAVLGVVLVVYWKFIIAGAAAIFCLVVLSNHKMPELEKPQVVDAVSAVQSVAVAKEEVDNDHQAFVEDCLAYTDYTKDKCEKLWVQDSPKMEEIQPASYVAPITLMDVDNVEYKERRAEALKKPNVVVEHYTYR